MVKDLSPEELHRYKSDKRHSVQQKFRDQYLEKKQGETDRSLDHETKFVKKEKVRGKWMPFEKVVMKEGGWKSITAVRAGLLRAYKCMLMGEEFCSIDEWPERVHFKFVEKSTSEEFSRSWAERVQYGVKPGASLQTFGASTLGGVSSVQDIVSVIATTDRGRGRGRGRRTNSAIAATNREETADEVLTEFCLRGTSAPPSEATESKNGTTGEDVTQVINIHGINN